jgi:hypothetical protein
MDFAFVFGVIVCYFIGIKAAYAGGFAQESEDILCIAGYPAESLENVATGVKHREILLCILLNTLYYIGTDVGN